MRFFPSQLILKSACAACLVALLVASAPVRAAEEKPAPAAVQAELSRLQERRAAELHARQLRLTKGRNYPVCRDVLANLNLLPTPGRGRGEMPIDSRFKLLRKPDWQTVDLHAHRDIVKRFWVNSQKSRISSVRPPEHPLSPEEMDAAIDAEIASGHALLQRVVLDFDHDGYPDEVFRYSVEEVSREDAARGYVLPGRYWRLAVNTGEPRGNTPETDRLLTTAGFLDVFLHDGRVFVIDIGGLGMVTVFEPFYLYNSQEVVGDSKNVCETQAVLEGK